MWHQSSRKTSDLLPFTDYGWKNSERGLEIMSNMKRVLQRLDFYTKRCQCNKGDMLCIPQKGWCGCTRNGRQSGPACKCIKEKCFNKSTGPSADTSLQHNTHTPEEIISEPTVLRAHTTEDINSDCECIYTSEEMSSECEDEENEDEDEVQCLEVDDPEIDNIMREVFLEMKTCYFDLLHIHTFFSTTYALYVLFITSRGKTVMVSSIHVLHTAKKTLVASNTEWLPWLQTS